MGFQYLGFSILGVCLVACIHAVARHYVHSYECYFAWPQWETMGSLVLDYALPKYPLSGLPDNEVLITTGRNSVLSIASECALGFRDRIVDRPNIAHCEWTERLCLPRIFTSHLIALSIRLSTAYTRSCVSQRIADLNQCEP